jgi:hypothetical protein
MQFFSMLLNKESSMITRSRKRNRTGARDGRSHLCRGRVVDAHISWKPFRPRQVASFYCEPTRQPTARLEANAHERLVKGLAPRDPGA